MNPLPVVIVEDEPMIARRLARLARSILGDEAGVIDCAVDLASAVPLLAGPVQPILILDLNLAGEDGFTLLREALAQPCQTVVVSANTERAMEAFELGVADFVAKPFTEERLAVALRRAQRRRGGERTRYLAVSLAGKVELIPLESITAIHGDDDYSSIETVQGRKHLHRKTLSALMEVLPPSFKRVHRSHIVNLAHVQNVLTYKGGRRTILLPNGVSVPLSRAHIDDLSAEFIT